MPILGNLERDQQFEGFHEKTPNFNLGTSFWILPSAHFLQGMGHGWLSEPRPRSWPGLMRKSETVF